MSDRMTAIPFSELLERIFSELRNQNSVFSISKEQFFVPENRKEKIFGEEISSVLGPAAGPHTQLAQNIIASYLTGARFIELKTVQVLDELVVEKPCIDARDECYNVEWSTELKVSEAYDEYLKSWFVLHLFDILFSKDWKKPSFVFNASIGYNLEGIRSEKIDRYIECMKDASGSPLFEEYSEVLSQSIEDGILTGTDFEGEEDKVKKCIVKIGKKVASSFTVSTMHGCPPDEIEKICRYLIEEKDLDIYVKLNPTLLGYSEVRNILDGIGYGHITLSESAFEKDLQYCDALPMLRRLKKSADEKKRHFGVKLTNTLSSVNDQNMLPGKEMYMSGKALFPISITLAERISEEFSGTMPISYSGGVDSSNAGRIYRAGLRPITLATDLLKPGGYTRLSIIEKEIEKENRVEEGRIKLDELTALSGYAREQKGEVDRYIRPKTDTPLPLFDCYVAPCVENCPIHQMIPDYVALAGEGRYAEALAVIYLDNALPNITGWICDHQCQNHCTRKDYEGPVRIRDVKKIVAEKGRDEYLEQIFEVPEAAPYNMKAAVIGGGPAGLASAYFLARAGFVVDLFEKDDKLGGVVSSTIPSFRIPDDVIEKDVSFIKQNGVNIHLSSKVTIKELKENGFKFIFVAIGAEKSKDAKVDGNGKKMSAIKFLRALKEGKEVDAGKSVVISGGGNTAMDASRRALRIPGVESVTVVYRRTENEMPADWEEYELAKKEGVEFRFLRSPKSIDRGKLTMKKIVLGDLDQSGRRRPVETDECEKIDATLLVNAIGESVDDAELEALGYDGEDENVFIVGDALTGPGTVVKAIRSSRESVEKAIDAVYSMLVEEDGDDEDEECSHHHGDECTCGHHHDDECTCDEDDEEDLDEEIDESEFREKENEYFSHLRVRKSRILPSLSVDESDFLKRESERCLECSYYCNKCVDVCPNRANVMVDMRSWEAFRDPFQIVHLDAYCNECGNCATFCPHSGKPYRDKFTVFSSPESFSESTNDGFYWSGEDLQVRYQGNVLDGSIDKDGMVAVDGAPAEVAMLIDELFTSYSYLLTRLGEESVENTD